VIKSIVVLKLKTGVRPGSVDELVGALGKLQISGMTALHMYRDAGLRAGNCDVAIIADLEDEEAYSRYDTDVEHSRIRRELAAPIAERIERIQVRL
jgi:hypothetical protein